MAREISISFALNAALGAGFKSVFQSASQSARNVTSAIREMEKSPVGHLGAAMAQQKEKIKGLAGSLKEASATLATLQSQARASGGATRLLTTQIEQAEATVRNLNGALARQRGLMLNTAAQAATTCGSVSQLARNYGDLTRNIERARKVQTAMTANRAQGDALRSQRADLNSRLAGTVATTATVALPVKLAISAEDTFADLRKVMDGASDEMLAQTFSDAQAMSNRTGKSFEDIVTIMAAAAQSGLGKTRGEMLSVADQAVKMSIAWGVSAETAGKSLANWRTSMGLTEEQSKNTADVINALSNEMNAEAGDINNIFTRMGAMMKSSGMASQDIAALATAFKAAGAECEVSATAMKNFTNVLAAGSAGMTDDKLNVFRYLEIDPDELQKQFYHDARGSILRVLEALKNNVKPEELNSIAGTAFGQDSIAAISPLIEQIDTLRKAFKIANSDVSGSVDDEYANRMKTTATAIGQATQSIRNLGVTAGNALLPAVGFVAKGISGLVSVVDGLVRRFPNLSSGVMIAGAALAAFAAGSLMLGLVVNTVRTGLNGFRGGLLRLSAAHIAATTSTAASTAATGSFGIASRIAGAGARFFAGGLRSILVATGVGALLVGLGVAINLLIDNWDTVVNAMSAAWSWVTDTWSRLGVFFSELGQNLVAAFAPVWDVVAGLATGAWNRIASIWSGITGFFSDLWSGVAGGALALWNEITGAASWAYERVSSIWGGITDFFSGIVDSIMDVFSKMFSWLRENFSWVFNTIDSISGFVGKITGAVGDAWNKAFGDDSEKKSAAPAAESAKKQSAAPAAANAGATRIGKLDASRQSSARSYAQFLEEKGAEKKAARGSKKTGGGFGKRSSGTGSASSRSGPVTVVTLGGDNSRPQTIFIPASGNAAQMASRAVSSKNEWPASPLGAALPIRERIGPVTGPASSLPAISGSAVKTPAVRGTSRSADIPLALPQTPALVGKVLGAKKQARQVPQAISVDLTQNFELIGRDPAAVRKVLEAVKPDFEALVRRALEKIQSDKRRTAYAQ